MLQDTQFKAYFKELKEALESYGKRVNPITRIIQKRRAGMLARCNNPLDSSYAEYGLRGIKVCDEWCGRDGAKNFIVWYCEQLAKFAEKYDTPLEAIKNLSIDRIRPNGNYKPKNCRLMPQIQNAYSTTIPARAIKFKDEFLPLWYIEKNILGINRVKKGGNLKIENGISDKIARALLCIRQGKKTRNTHYMFLKPKMKQFLINFDKKAILTNTNFYVWYDFFENPLHFNGKTLLSQCPKCEAGEVDIVKYEHIYCKCDSCDFNHIIISNQKTDNTKDVARLKNLPMVLWGKTIVEKIYADNLEKQRQHYRMKMFKETEAKRKARLDKAKENENKRLAKKQIESGVDLTKICKKVRNQCGKYKTPILELKTRKAIRVRLNKEWETITPEIRAQAKERMIELLREEKTSAKANNPHGYYLRQQRCNDNRAKRLRGSDYEIKRRGNNKVEQTKDIIAKPRKKAEIKKEYFTQAELAQMGLIQDKAQVNEAQNQKYFDLKMQTYKHKIKDSKEAKLINDYLLNNKQQTITIKYTNRDFVWQGESDSIFCRCGEGVLRLDMQNKITTRCVFCGFALNFEGKIIQ